MRCVEINTMSHRERYAEKYTFSCRNFTFNRIELWRFRNAFSTLNDTRIYFELFLLSESLLFSSSRGYWRYVWRKYFHLSRRAVTKCVYTVVRIASSACRQKSFILQKLVYGANSTERFTRRSNLRSVRRGREYGERINERRKLKNLYRWF